jgi:hypothetical protein
MSAASQQVAAPFTATSRTSESVEQDASSRALRSVHDA